MKHLKLISNKFKRINQFGILEYVWEIEVEGTNVELIHNPNMKSYYNAPISIKENSLDIVEKIIEAHQFDGFLRKGNTNKIIIITEEADLLLSVEQIGSWIEDYINKADDFIRQSRNLEQDYKSEEVTLTVGDIKEIHGIVKEVVHNLERLDNEFYYKY